MEIARRRAYRAHRRARAALAADNLRGGAQAPRKFTDALNFGEGLTTDRVERREQAQAYMCETSNHPFNDYAAPMERLQDLRALADDSQMNNGRAKLSVGTGVGLDGRPVELWRSAPWNLVVLFGILSMVTCMANRLEAYLGIGLQREIPTDSLSQFRWICKSSARHHLPEPLTPKLGYQRRRTQALTLGFEPGMRRAHVCHPLPPNQ